MVTRCRLGIVLALLILAGALPAQEPAMTPEETANFLLKAEVINSRHTSKGVTSPYRLTMRLGNVTHDAHFQPVDEARPTREFSDGSVELNFRDSYKYNIAAYQLSKLLGLDHMMPVTVFRKWSGMSGSMAWWLPAKMDETSGKARSWSLRTRKPGASRCTASASLPNSSMTPTRTRPTC